MPRLTLGLLAALLLVPPASAQRPAGCHAVTGARVVVAPGEVLVKATVVVRDGVITAVGPDVAVPPDALVIDGKGLTVYAGFVDAGSPRGYDAALRRSEGGPPAPEDLASGPLAASKPDHRKGMTPEFAVRAALKADEEAVTAWRKAGFTAQLVTPEGGYLNGTSALMSLSGSVPRDAVLRAPVAQHAALRQLFGGDYPIALMGTVAHCRQAFLDAGWAARRAAAFEAGGSVGRRPAADPALDALKTCLDGRVPVAFDADTADQIHRALDFAEEFKLKPLIVGGRSAWKVADRLKAAGVPVILRLDFPEAGERDVDSPIRVREDRERLRQLDVAGAAALHKAGVRFAFSTAGVTGDKPGDKFRANLRRAVEAGLPADAALAALTTTAAELLGVPAQLGRVAVGRAAHLAVTDGDFLAAATKVKFVFADGVRLDPNAPPPEAADAPVRRGRGDAPPAEPKTPAEPKPAAPKPEKPSRPVAGDAVRALAPALEAVERLSTETEADRLPTLQTGGDVLLRNATVLTATGKDFPRADILVRGGKIRAVGPDMAAPAGVKVIDATGMFVMPGVVDTHSHFGISGGVNEASLSVVPEVRVRDALDSEDPQIYRAAAGGVTTARLLHGSANVVGGQDAVIKMKVGRPAKEMLVTSGPRGVKFALGENVKRTDGRFPNSRPGVEAVLVRAFSEAQAYRKAHDQYAADKATPEPRRDLRLEALADVLSGDLKMHCHCYRSDEILMLLRVADRYKFKVQSLQHVLEGYKVAPEIAAHGASVSLFSDWWAYKVEAFDAIPYAAKLLQDAGASVCLKSDDNELMRHLPTEAAKLVKYGGLTHDEALRSITRNAAEQLGLGARIGTIEVGKDADLAVYNGHPLNAYSRCEMTLVEGEVVFQHAAKFTPSKLAAAPPGDPTPAKFAPLPERPRGAVVLSFPTIHLPGKPPFVGTVVYRGRVVTEIGLASAQERELNPGDVKIDASGLHVYPGLIDAGTVLGLVEIASARETVDFKDGGDFQPDLRAATAINPDSELIPVTRANGVTTVVTRPTGSTVAGQGALINLAGWVPAEMVVVDPLSLHVEFPTEPFERFGTSNWPAAANAAERRKRDDKLRKVRELFEQARRYAAGRAANPDAPLDPRLEAVGPYARGEKPVVIEANRVAEIRAVLKLADELKVKLILSGGTEAWKLAGELKRRDVPVILGPVLALPQDAGDRFDAPYAAAAKLHEAGVRFCIRSAGSSNARNLPYEAAMAVAYGLPADEGLKAVTVNAAQILGVDDRLGDLKPGYTANIVITNGDILQHSTQVLGVVIDGRGYEPTSKQTKLYDRYRKRLTEVQLPAGER